MNCANGTRRNTLRNLLILVITYHTILGWLMYSDTHTEHSLVDVIVQRLYIVRITKNKNDKGGLVEWGDCVARTLWRS